MDLKYYDINKHHGKYKELDRRLERLYRPSNLKDYKEYVKKEDILPYLTWYYEMDNIEDIIDMVKWTDISIKPGEIESYFSEKLHEDPIITYVSEHHRLRVWGKTSDEYNPGCLSVPHSENLTPHIQYYNYKKAMYTFDGIYGLAYSFYERYIAATKDRALTLLNILKSISQGESKNIAELIDSLDIELNKDGDIRIFSLERLLFPTVWNIDDLLKIVEEANKPESYVGKSEKFMSAEDIFLYQTEFPHVLQGPTPEYNHTYYLVPYTYVQELEYNSRMKIEKVNSDKLSLVMKGKRSYMSNK